MAERLRFVLDGRDDLSRVLGHAGDSAVRLRNQMTDAADGSGRAILTLTRDADGRLRDLEGRFVNAADAARLLASRTSRLVPQTADWAGVADRARDAGDALKKSLISLVPAAIPAAAAIAPLAAATGAAAVAVGVYAVALGPQVKAMGEAVKAEGKYQDAVEESGARSAEAVKAQAEYARQVAKLPAPTREAAAALSALKDEYKAWSEELAADTMGPFVKSLGIVRDLLPHLTPLVKGTSSELDRMMTILAGGMQTPGFDKLVDQFTKFSTGVLQRANDALVRFMRTSQGEVGDSLSKFMAFAREQGPAVGEALSNIGDALTNLLIAGADVGVGMLQVVNALAKMVAAVPPEVITTLLQLAIAVKAVKLAVLGFAAVKAAAVAIGVQMAAMGVAASGATGGLARASAAIGTLSRTAKLAVAGTGIGLLVIAISELSNIGKQAPADIDKMTSSLAQFGQSGKLTGEAARVLSKDFGEFDEALRGLARPGQWDQIQQGFTNFFGQDSTPVKRWKETIGGVDDALAQMVKSGNADQAAAAFSMLAKRAESQGLTTSELRTQMDGYKQSLADAKFEQQLAAEAMGLFGAQAQSTQAKLAEQKASADGLRQAIQALNDVQRAGMGGMIGFEAAIDAASKAAAENAGSLKMVGGRLDLNSEKSRTAAGALNDLAAKTDEAAAAARESGASWETVNGIYTRGREKLIASADAMGLTREQAIKLANQILKTPDKTARLKGNMEDLQRKLDSAKAQLKRVPDSRKAQIRASIAQLEAAIREARVRMTSIDGKTAHTYIYTHHIVTSTGEARKRKPGKAGHYAQGGLVGFPGGGSVRGPGTGTSDSIIARVSNGEYVTKAAAVRKYGQRLFDDLNAMRVTTGHAAGMVSRSSSAAMSGPSVAGMVRSVVAELMAAQQPVEVRVFLDGEPVRGIARAEVRKANGELVQVLNAGGGM